MRVRAPDSSLAESGALVLQSLVNLASPLSKCRRMAFVPSGSGDFIYGELPAPDGAGRAGTSPAPTIFLDNAALRDDVVGAGLVPARPAPSGAGKFLNLARFIMECGDRSPPSY